MGVEHFPCSSNHFQSSVDRFCHSYYNMSTFIVSLEISESGAQWNISQGLFSHRKALEGRSKILHITSLWKWEINIVGR